jgi:hypothetical protein
MKSNFRLGARLSWAILFFFSLLGPACIYFAFQKHGANFVMTSVHAVIDDPIYLYACADLFAIFAIITYWLFRAEKHHSSKFWLWALGFFIFGTPALVAYLLTRSSEPGQ